MEQCIIHIINTDIDSVLMGLSELQSLEQFKRDDLIKSMNSDIAVFINILKTRKRKELFYICKNGQNNYSIYSNYFNKSLLINDYTEIFDVVHSLNNNSKFILVNNLKLSVIDKTNSLHEIDLSPDSEISKKDMKYLCKTLLIENYIDESNLDCITYKEFCDIFQLANFKNICELKKSSCSYDIFDLYI